MSICKFSEASSMTASQRCLQASPAVGTEAPLSSVMGEQHCRRTIPPRRQTRSSHPLRIEAGTLRLHPFVKTTRLQHSVQLFVERMRDCPWQLRMRDPKLILSSLLRSSTHSHARILRTSAVDHTIFFLRNPDLHHGCKGAHTALLLDLGACHSEKSS